jgi:hypothetical protein
VKVGRKGRGEVGEAVAGATRPAAAKKAATSSAV